MTMTVLRTYLKRVKPKVIHCRVYKTFSNDSFQDCVSSKLFLGLITMVSKNCYKRLYFMNNSLTGAHMKTSQLKKVILEMDLTLTDLLFSTNEITLSIFLERQRLVTNDKEIADDILKKCFSNAVKNERIRKFSDTKPLADNISYSTLKS